MFARNYGQKQVLIHHIQGPAQPFWPYGVAFAPKGLENPLGAFLVGFRSADKPHLSYIHFVGVDSELRSQGIAARGQRTPGPP